MLDLSKLGGDTGSAGAMPTPGASSAPLDSLPDFAPVEAPQQENAGEAPWDTVGRLLWGTAEQGGTLGQVPLVGDVMRFPGEVARNAVAAGGAGLGAVFGGLGEALGRLPSLEHLTDTYGLGDPNASQINPADGKYGATPEGAMTLLNDLRTESGETNMAAQFMALGQWQKANDPEAFKAWEAALKEAQDSTHVGSKAGEVLSNYIRNWAVTYSDMTPEGITGWLDVAPELAYGTQGSFGQGLVDGLTTIMTPQRHAEIGGATLSGNQGGLGEVLGGHRIAEGYIDMGSRLNELIHISDTDPGKLTAIEAAAVEGMKEKNWTARHAYTYLVRHGQGFSSEGATQLALSMALDPTMVAGIGASQAASVGARAALGYSKSATAAGRLQSVYQGVAERIGTTVAATRADPILGPSMKIARTVVDPFSIFPGPQGAAKVDVFASAGLEGARRGFGPGAVSNVMRRADAWGVRDVVDRAYGTTAMNFARKYVGSRHVDNLTRFMEPGARRILDEDLIQELGTASPKDAVTRMADYVFKRREFWLSDMGVDQLAERMVKMTGKTRQEMDTALATMGRDEQAVWHAMTYSEAFRDFVTAVRAAPAEEWGKLAPKLDDLVILNPSELDNVAAEAVLDNVRTLQQGAKAVGAEKAIKGNTKAAIAEWNTAASRYSLIENLGRINSGGAAQLERKLNSLQRVIDSGGLHMALGADEMRALPKSFTQSFLGKWTSLDGTPIWRLGFKPKALQATGLVYDDAGKLVARYEPAIENVTDAIPKATGGLKAVTDPLGRMIPGVVKDSRLGGAGRTAYDALDVAMSTAADMVSGERLMTSMEQSFRKQMRSAGFGDKVAKQVFKQSRDYAQENGFTLAGMSPDEFWKANKSVLGDLVDARVAKRDLFSMLATSAGGDLRLLGLSSGATQRIRSGLIARGLDSNNYLGAVTVKVYNLLRYTLNPMFFLQAEFDAPWFNMYRGIMPDLTGRMPKPGTATYEMQGIVEAMSHTSMSRDLAMDFTERIATIGWQQDVLKGLKSAGIEQGLGTRVKNRLGRLILNNEMMYLNTRAGEVVFDALDTTRRALDERAAQATTAAEAAAWRNQKLDIENVLGYLSDELAGTLGRQATPDEIGRRYLSEMIEDSMLEVRTPEGLLDYQRVAQKGNYHVPTNLGELKPLNLDYGAESLGLPNIYSANDLRVAMAEGRYSVPEVRDIMKQLGYHKDHIDRFTNAVTFNWRHYFDDIAVDLGMTRFEMQGIEDLVAAEAKSHGMKPIEYITQVLPIASKKARKVKAKGPQYASEGRIVTPEEMATLNARGQELMSIPGAKQPVDLAASIDTIADDLYTRTALQEWGGASYSPRTGHYIEDANPWLYHGTQPAFEGGIRRYGVMRGDWVDDPASKLIPANSKVIYRARKFNTKGGSVKAEGWSSGNRAAPEALEVSKDGGKTWSRVVEGTVDDGPWVSAVGKTTSISIEAAQDPAKFRAALDKFVAENADELQRPGMYVGTFRDDKIGKVQFDVARATFTEADTEAVQAHLGRTGGAYNVSTGNGLFAPRLQPADELANMGLTDHMKFVLQTLRLAKEGKAGADEMAALVAANLQPSMKETLLDYFEKTITGKDGLIERAMAAGDAKTAQDLNLVLEDLRGGWGPAADKQFRDLVIRRAGGEVSSLGDHLPQPWKDKSVNAYADSTELVPTSVLDTFREIDREVTPKFRGDFAHLDELTEDIRVNGFREPVILEYDPTNGLALLGEGNHRLAVAKRLGLEGVPTRVIRSDLSTDPKAVNIAERYEPTLRPNEDGYFPGDASPSQVGLPTAADIAEPEVERAARYFSQYIQEVMPNIGAGTALKDIVNNIPVEGASPYHFTQGLLMDTLGENFRLAEKDAIRLAHMQTERSVLERSMNHPFFAMYPSSYFWGKVIPETFKFIAYEPFGMKTSLGLQGYLHVKQSIDLQSTYDTRMQQLWESVGKSATMGLISYLSPSMPWEDMSSNLPPWVRGLSKGEDFRRIFEREFDTFSPERWVRHFIETGEELTGAAQDALAPEVEALGGITQPGPIAPEPVAPTGFKGTVTGGQLAPVLTGELQSLQEALSGK